MTTKTLTPQWRRLATAFFGWWLASAAMLAQTGTGTVQGRVYNPSGKEYVGNAEVRLEGTNQVTYTESDGSFRFDNVAAGPTSITVNYTGYESVKQSFTVTAGLPAVREINLVSTAAMPKVTGEVVQLQAFTVESEREGNSKAIMAQRRNMNITTSVSSDIFGDVADGNVGEFLKYLPGVDLDYVEAEARSPRLGGMDGQYVGVSFDGMRTASADQNRGGGAASRATSFEGFSITSIESIEINRTASPENDADSPAGTVNMKTKRAFDRKGRRVDYNFGINFNDQEFTLRKTPGPRDQAVYKWKPNWQLGYAESFLNQRFGVLLSASHSASFSEQHLETNIYNRTPLPFDPRPLVLRQITFKDGPKFTIKDSMLLTADFKATPRLVLSLNMIYSYYEGQFSNRQFDFVAANDNANVNVANGRASVDGDGMTTIIANRVASGSTTTSKNNNVATLNNSAGTAAKLVYTRQIAPKFEYKVGSLVVDGAMAFSRSVNNYEALERGFSSSEGGGVASSWIATRPSPQSWEWSVRQTSGSDWYNLASFTNTNTSIGGTRVDTVDRVWITEKWTGTTNARWSLPFMERFPTVVKFGGKWDEETRKNNDHGAWNVWSYNGPGGNATTVSPTLGVNTITSFGSWANLGSEFVSSHPFNLGTTKGMSIYNINGVLGVPPRVSRDAISGLFHSHPEMFVPTGTPENWYTAFVANARDFRQTVTAAYAQADTRLTSKLQVRFGVRMERTQNALTEFDPKTRAEVLAAGYAVNAVGTNNGRAVTIPGMQYEFMSNPRVTRHSQYHNYFPSLLIKYQIMPNFEFQAGANKGIQRAPIDNLTGLWVINESNNTVTAPNPDLLPEHDTGYQARLAYYFGGRSPGQFTLGASQIDSTNFIQTFNYTSADFGVDDPAYTSYTFISSANAPDLQKTRSMEVNYNQTLGFLPGEYLRGINVNFNYARVYVNVRRPGVAPHRITSRLGYSYKRFNGSVGMTWTDDKPESSTYGRTFGAITKYDLTLNFRLVGQSWLYVQGRNITNVKDEWYESPPGVQEGQQRALRAMEGYGTNWVFGVKGNF